MFETDRLRLRAICKPDFEKVHALWNIQDVRKMLSVGYVVPSVGFKADQDPTTVPGHDYLLYAVIETKVEAEFVGVTMLFDTVQKTRDSKIGIALLPEFWGQGFGTETMRFVVDYAFRELALHRVTLSVNGNNTAAIKIYKKIGFVQEGVQRKANWINGKWQDIIWMAILDEEWEESNPE
ncbi:acyl-CoA N-acyltransferase [Rhodocollybia butyracea]|uniref:Acyl-CoA N-acyltransferase n=1 Tax=Rhodocollybia butyracea TaxID=206335 RepID=A0A9P5Q3D0_9AGAR|nr:acyl-CoA N-acyltransferase [Rhodocollybia butyracea]